MRAADNPFRADRVQSLRYRFHDGDDWESMLARLQKCSFRAAIVGPEGVGKTTLHEELEARLKEAGHPIRWLRLNRENRRQAPALIRRAFADMTPKHLLFIDGAEQLGFWRWQLMKRRAGRLAGLVINTHTPGWLPTLIECKSSVSLLSEVADELLPEELRPPQEMLVSLFDRHAGNIRLCLRSLYDQWASAPDVSELPRY
ncbi:MAG: hypothetical protein R3B91_09740 [Planctomycetaceae bacterium]